MSDIRILYERDGRAGVNRPVGEGTFDEILSLMESVCPLISEGKNPQGERYLSGSAGNKIHGEPLPRRYTLIDHDFGRHEWPEREPGELV